MNTIPAWIRSPRMPQRLGVVYKSAILLYALAVILFSYREGLTAFAKGFALLLVGLFLFRSAMQPSPIAVGREYLYLAAWFLVGVVASALSPESATALPRVLTLLQILPIALIMTSMLCWNGSVRFYWLGFVAVGLLSGVISLLNPGLFSTFDGRMFGTLGNANTFAVMLVAANAICLAEFVGARRLSVRIASLLGSAFFLYLVTRTGSRMGMLASLATIAASLWVYQMDAARRGLKRSVYVFAVIGVLIAGSVVYISTSQFMFRLDNLVEALETGDFSGGDTSLRNRALMYDKSFELFLESPLIGVGLDVFSTAGIDYRQIGNNAHTNYMEILSSTGLVGFILYYAIYVGWWRRLWSMRKAVCGTPNVGRYALLVSLVAAIMVIDLALVTYYTKITWLIFAGMIAELRMLPRRPGR